MPSALSLRGIKFLLPEVRQLLSRMDGTALAEADRQANAMFAELAEEAVNA